MSTITLPIWIFALSFGVPCVCLLLLMGFLLRKIRNPKKNEFVNLCLQNVEDQQASNQKFHSDLLRMQVDTIFNGLNAIIETERLKINALLSPSNNILFEAKAGPVEEPEKETTPHEAQEEQQTAELTLEQQMVNIVSSGEDIEEIATELGLSQTEIDLAKRMRSSRGSKQVRKLEAVA